MVENKPSTYSGATSHVSVWIDTDMSASSSSPPPLVPAQIVAPDFDMDLNVNPTPFSVVIVEVTAVHVSVDDDNHSRCLCSHDPNRDDPTGEVHVATAADPPGRYDPVGLSWGAYLKDSAYTALHQYQVMGERLTKRVWSVLGTNNLLPRGGQLWFVLGVGTTAVLYSCAGGGCKAGRQHLKTTTMDSEDTVKAAARVWVRQAWEQTVSLDKDGQYRRHVLEKTRELVVIRCKNGSEWVKFVARHQRPWELWQQLWGGIHRAVGSIVVGWVQQYGRGHFFTSMHQSIQSTLVGYKAWPWSSSCRV